MFSYRIFTVVAEKKSFSRAAECLHMTPSAISHSIAKLENDLGLSLFVRTQNGVFMTDAGSRLLRHMRTILNTEELIRQECSQIKGLVNGTIRLATTQSTCTNWIPQIITSYRKLYPNIEVDVCQGSYADITKWISSGYADLGFSTTAIDSKDLDIVPLCKDRIICIASKDYFSSHKDYVTADDIKGQKIILQRAGDDEDTMMVLHRMGITITSRSYVEDDQCIVSLAESGLGIAIYPELVLKCMIHNARIYPIRPAIYRTIALLHLKEQPLSPAAEKMKDLILGCYRTTKVS